MSSEPIQSIYATLGAKEGVYDRLTPEMDPHGDPLYKAAFKTKEGVKILWVNSIEYYALHVGDHGLLKYNGDEMISFDHEVRQSFDMND